jgi:hypothetical protein
VSTVKVGLGGTVEASPGSLPYRDARSWARTTAAIRDGVRWARYLG